MSEEETQKFLEEQHRIRRGDIVTINVRAGGGGDYFIRRSKYRIKTLSKFGALTMYVQDGRELYPRWLTYWEIDKALGRIVSLKGGYDDESGSHWGDGKKKKRA